jgi:hypothetical protein
MNAGINVEPSAAIADIQSVPTGNHFCQEGRIDELD